MINITFLGTSDSVPSVKRNHTAILLTYNGENILVDCGEGTQRQFRKVGLNPCKITKILLTHRHADHTLGLPGLLKTMALTGYNKKLEIFGPKGTKIFMENLFKTFGKIEEYKINIQEVSGKFFENKDFFLEAEKMSHGVPCNAYSFVKKEQIRIDKNKLKKHKLPEGVHLKDLKLGKNIKYNGKIYKAKDFTFVENGKKISFVLDTSTNKNIVPFVKDSDLLVCESSFSKDLENKAREYGHLTSKQAGKIAKKSKSKKLIITHISQRFENDMNRILKEVKGVFKNTDLVKDLDVVNVE